jgi:hypothetical protein
LLFAKLHSILGKLALAGLTVLTRRSWAVSEDALLRIALVALKKQFLSLAAA